jgi:hypothetical protein
VAGAENKWDTVSSCFMTLLYSITPMPEPHDVQPSKP